MHFRGPLGVKIALFLGPGHPWGALSRVWGAWGSSRALPGRPGEGPGAPQESPGGPKGDFVHDVEPPFGYKNGSKGDPEPNMLILKIYEIPLVFIVYFT